MSATQTLMRYRLAELSHVRSSKGLRESVAGGLILAIALLAAGWFAAPSLLESSQAAWTAQIRPVALPGLRALEAAFWASALLAAVQCFRVMELLFRRQDIVALSLMPVPTSALFVERLTTGLLESVGFAVLGSMFFAPLVLQSPLVALLCSVMLVISQMLATCASIGVVMWFGTEYGHPEARIGGDAYGGTGAAFIYAPGASLAVSLVGLVLLQLTLGEVLKAGHITRAFWMGLGLAAGIGGAAAVVGWRNFSKFHLVAAWFREADTVGYSTDVAYQRTNWTATPLERFGLAPFALRRTWIQWHRAGIVSNNVLTLLLAATALASYWLVGDGIVPFVLAPSVALLLVHPWRRLGNPLFGNSHASVLPLTDRDEIVASELTVVALFARVVVYALALAGVLAARGMDPLLPAVSAVSVALVPFWVHASIWRLTASRPGSFVPAIAVVAACALYMVAPVLAPMVLFPLPFVVIAVLRAPQSAVRLETR